MYVLRLVQALYRKLVALYPRQFREQFSESMEQTFHDLYHERRAKAGLFGFVFWTFTETAIGVLREHLLLVSPGAMMKNLPKTIGASAILGLLIIIPLIVMEFANRRQFNEGFPAGMFFVMWLNLFAVSAILLPIAHGWRIGNRQIANAISTQRETLLTKPGAAAIIGVIVFLVPGILPWLDTMGWLSLDGLFDGPNPEVTFLPGRFVTVGLILFPIAAGIIAGVPIVSTLQAGGRLLAHPVNLIIVILISATFAFGFTGLLVDQWPCFIGVPNCD